MSDLDRKVVDLIADGRITEEDADAVLTFRQFLAESGPPSAPDEDGNRTFPPGHPLHTREARQAYRERWGPYMQGEADGPMEDGPDSRTTAP